MILKKKILKDRMRTVLVSCFLLLAISCSHNQQNQDFASMDGVELGADPTNVEDIASVSDTTEVPKEVDAEMVGPALNTESSSTTLTEQTKIIPEPVIGLILGPGLYRSFATIGLLKAFAKKNIKISIISGQEMSAIVALYYARDLSVSSFEWQLYKLARSGEFGLAPYSEKWREKTLNKLLDEFKKTQFEDLKLPSFLSLYNKKTNLIEHFAKGQVYGPLLRIFDLSNEGIQGSSVAKLVFPTNFMRKMGADLVLVVDVLGKNVKFKKINEEISSFYEKAVNKITAEKKDLEHYFLLNLSQAELDSPKIEESVRYCEEKGLELADKIQVLVNDWKKQYLLNKS